MDEYKKMANEEVDTCFDVCPICSRHDGFINIGRGHWMVCHKHKKKWFIGSNLFSSWENEDEEIWRENHKIIKDYELIYWPFN